MYIKNESILPYQKMRLDREDTFNKYKFNVFI